MTTLSAVIIFHGEQFLVHASVTSFHKCCDRAVAAGIHVQRVIVIDRPDALTRSVVEGSLDRFDIVKWVDFGDLGQSRNAGRDASSGEYLAFFDGDDLWGAEWLSAAVLQLKELHTAIAHPEVIYYFSNNDYLRQSQTEIPQAGLAAYYFMQAASTDPDFDARSIMFNNIWTANSIARRAVYERHPYLTVDRSQGFGVEDWTWNVETLAGGIDHIVVPRTVHCIRLKSEGSLGVQNNREQILPRIHEYASKLESF